MALSWHTAMPHDSVMGVRQRLTILSEMRLEKVGPLTFGQPPLLGLAESVRFATFLINPAVSVGKRTRFGKHQFFSI